MKNYNKFISEQRELLTEKTKSQLISTGVAGLGDITTAADIVSPTHSMGMDRNFRTAYDMKNIMKGLPNILGKEYSERDLVKLIDGMNEHERNKLEQQVNTLKSFHSQDAIKSIQTKFKSRDDVVNNWKNNVFIPGGYAN
jgi:hypothetical protein